jgi:hypothetical protein
MTTRDDLARIDEDMLLVEGFDEALLGYAPRCGQPALAVYDRARCIEILVQRDGMSEEDAEEFFEFNVVGAWVGDRTPLFLYRTND